MSNVTYTREQLASLPPTENHGARYWRAHCREVFSAHPEITTIEVVKSGLKTDSRHLHRGDKYTPAGSGLLVIIASTGGRWGKSRRDFWPTA